MSNDTALNAEIYAVFKYPTYGRTSDSENAAKAGLKVGEKYLLAHAEVGGWHTDVYLTGLAGRFNSVLFDFEDEAGKAVDICCIPAFRNY